MPGIIDNLSFWSHYNWDQQGDEWSAAWGSTQFLWWGTIFPRILSFVPHESILEIAPGYGRFTFYLKDLCQHLAIVDLTERCIEACKQRFASSPNISYYLNDGKSLAMIPDHSIDFAFSFDSLVHAEADVIEAYIDQLATKLRPNAIGFIHHSNIGTLRDSETGMLPFVNVHWRAESMTAETFAAYCGKAGLQCISQEIVNWDGQYPLDCISVFTPKSSRLAQPNQVIHNDDFWAEALRLQKMSQIYRHSSAAPAT